MAQAVVCRCDCSICTGKDCVFCYYWLEYSINVSSDWLVVIQVSYLIFCLLFCLFLRDECWNELYSGFMYLLKSSCSCFGYFKALLLDIYIFSIVMSFWLTSLSLWNSLFMFGTILYSEVSRICLICKATPAFFWVVFV